MLADLGGAGRYPNNCARDLRDRLRQQQTCEALEVEFPLRSLGGQTFNATQSILLPHVWFAHVFREYPEAFKARVCPSHDALRAFWREMDDNPQMVGHPLQDRPGYRRWAVPLSLHGDGVPVTGVAKAWQKGMNIWSWNSLVASGATTQFNFYIYGVWKAMCCRAGGHPTMRLFWRILAWSLRWFYRGLWPDVDWNGVAFTNPIDVARALTPLAGVPRAFYYGVLWVVRGDLEYLWQDINLPNCNTNEPCCYCPANTTTFPMFEFRLARAAWAQRIYTAAMWLASDWSSHELFTSVHGGISVLTVYADLMHCKHLGTDQYFYGSVLWLLCFRVLPHTPLQNLIDVFSQITANYGNAPCRYTNLTMNMFCNGSDPPSAFPCLKGRAAECRHLGAALLQVWRRHHDASDPQHVQIRMALEASVNAEEILDAHPRDVRFPPDVRAAFQDNIFTYLLLFNSLADFYTAEGLKLFDITVKAHYLAHIALMSAFLNPRLAWTYSGEDFMHHSKRLFSACTRGCKPHLTSKKFSFRYLVGMHLMMCLDAGALFR